MVRIYRVETAASQARAQIVEFFRRTFAME
jgi:hypothetical protein